MSRAPISEKLTETSLRPARAGEFVSRFLVVAAICALISLAVATGLVALTQGIGAMPLPYNLHVVDVRLPGVFRLHMLASGASLALMPLVFATRRYHRRWHRPLGRLTALFVVAGALSSFPVAYASTSGAIARAGFAAQGSVWLALVVAGVIAIRRKDRAHHATLMIAMAAVASGAIWVRLTTTVATAWDLPFHPVYSCATWLGWLVPLTIVVALSPTPLFRRPGLPGTALAT
jgi:hypothetical protein